jgi:uncharacterized protein YoxC
MEQIPIITESVQYGVIGICITLILANAACLVIVVKTFVSAILKLYESIDALKTTIGELTKQVERLSIRTGITNG